MINNSDIINKLFNCFLIIVNNIFLIIKAIYIYLYN